MPIHDVKLDVKRSQSASAPEEGSGGLTSLGLRVLRFTSPRVDCAVAVNCDTADCATVKAVVIMSLRPSRGSLVQSPTDRMAGQLQRPRHTAW